MNSKGISGFRGSKSGKYCLFLIKIIFKNHYRFKRDLSSMKPDPIFYFIR